MSLPVAAIVSSGLMLKQPSPGKILILVRTLRRLFEHQTKEYRAPHQISEFRAICRELSQKIDEAADTDRPLLARVEVSPKLFLCICPMLLLTLLFPLALGATMSQSPSRPVTASDLQFERSGGRTLLQQTQSQSRCEPKGVLSHSQNGITSTGIMSTASGLSTSQVDIRVRSFVLSQSPLHLMK